MRVTARPSRSTRDVEIDVGSLAAPAEAAVPAAWSARGNRAPLLIAVASVVVVAITAFLIASQAFDDSPGPGVRPPPTGTPAATATATSDVPRPTASPTTSPGGSDGGAGLASWDGTTAVVVAIVIGVLLTVVLWFLRSRRRGSRQGTMRIPGGVETALAAADQPRASLGTPDVLVLTESASEGDVRLRERVRDQEQAIFANLQLACSFYPTDDWVFSSARLTVVLAREDGREAPAPIAYSLRPLSDRDGSAREQSVEIGADMKFVSVKGGEKSTGPGNEFVRGYGLQESVSYWEFTATPHQPLQGSFLLWLIARAPRESDLMVKSTLQVRVAPRSIWSRADGPSVAGTGEVSLLLGLKEGPPYRARLGGSPPEEDVEPWLVDVR